MLTVMERSSCQLCGYSCHDRPTVDSDSAVRFFRLLNRFARILSRFILSFSVVSLICGVSHVPCIFARLRREFQLAGGLM